MNEKEMIRIANSLERIADVLAKGTVFVAEDKHILADGTGATLRQVEKLAAKTVQSNIMEKGC